MIAAGTAFSVCPPLLLLLGLKTTSCAKLGVSRLLDVIGSEVGGMLVEKVERSVFTKLGST